MIGNSSLVHILDCQSETTTHGIMKDSLSSLVQTWLDWDQVSRAIPLEAHFTLTPPGSHHSLGDRKPSGF